MIQTFKFTSQTRSRSGPEQWPRFHSEPVVNANPTLVAVPPTRWTAIVRRPKIDPYDMLLCEMYRGTV